jgi:hypothetical protein
VGPVFAFHQYLAEGVTRLNDEEWQEKIDGAEPPTDVPWMEELFGGQ